MKDKKKHNTETYLFKSTGIMSGFTLISRLLGFGRDMVIAFIFGAQGQADAFFVAFKIPNFMRRLFTEGAFSQALVPVFAKEDTNPEQAKLFVSHLLGNLGLILFCLTLVVEIFAPVITAFFAPGFLEDRSLFKLCSQLLMLTFPYVLMIALTAVCGAVQNARSHFAVTAFTPILLNITLILAALLFAPQFEQPIKALGWGVFVAGLIQFIFQLPFLYRLGLLVYPRFSLNNHAAWTAVKNILPALIGVSVVQTCLFLDSIYASFLIPGSISWLYYADRITSLPLGIFGVAIATAVLPALSNPQQGATRQAFFETLDWGLRLILLIACPAAAALCVLAEPILVTLLYHGEFDSQSVHNTAQALRVFAVAIPACMIIKLFASACYAKQQIKPVVKIAFISIAGSVVVSLALMYPLAHVGIACATTFAAFTNAYLLLEWLRRHENYYPRWGKKYFLTSLSVAIGAMVFFLIWGMENITDWYVISTQDRAIYLLLLCVFGFFSYAMTLYVSGLRWRHLRVLQGEK